MKNNLCNICAIGALLITAGMGMSTSCTNYDDPLTANLADEGGVYTVVIDATLTATDVNQTRALGFDGGALKTTWAATDKVSVYYKNNSVGTLSPSSTGTATTMLTGTLSFTDNPNSTLYLYLPGKDMAYDQQDGTLVTLASETDYATATADIKAVDRDNKIVTVAATTFTKQQAVVKFMLKDKDGNSIKPTSLSITDDKRKLVATSDGTTTTKGFIAVTSATATDEYYVALQGISESGLSLSAVIGTDVYSYYKDNVTFENGKYYTVTVKMEKMGEAVQLWDGGPYWAEVNLPGHYQWAAVTPNTKCDDESCPYREKIDNKWTWTKYIDDDNKVTLEEIDDAARQQWGSPWRMPTAAEFKALDENTTYVIYKDNDKYRGIYQGILLTGKGSYSDKSIFLPYTGYWSGSSTIGGLYTGHYWSSSLYNSSQAVECSFSSGGLSVSNYPFRTRGCAIRPVHD